MVKNKNMIPNFLIKLLKILNEKENQDIISWNNDGESFVIKNINNFLTIVIPKYFKHKNFRSFVRQLNLYDFHKSNVKNSEY